MKRSFFSIFFVFMIFSAFSIEFSFRYSEGESYRILSEINETVYFNNRFSNRQQIKNHAFVHVEKTHEDGSADLTATYATTYEANINGYTEWSREYKSAFSVNRKGEYTISDDVFMPSVRNVPTFPDGDVQPGDIWRRPAMEAHDFGIGAFNLKKPVIFASNAVYQYRGTVEKQGKTFHLIKVEYSIDGKTNVPQDAAPEYPVAFEGTSQQNLYWDETKGRLAFYDEHFEISFLTNLDNLNTFVGNASAQILDDALSHDDIAEIEKEAQDIDGLDVRQTDKGLVLSLENIQFVPDSAKWLPTETAKLEKLAEILKRHRSHDFLISGHTAKAGSEKMQKQLSLDRANAVAEYFEKNGVQSRSKLFVEGHGSDQPLADNKTEAGKAKNRRVEITILQ